MKRKVLAWLLTLAMVFTMIPTLAFAAEKEVPALPTATVTEIENEDLTFAMNFKADEVTTAQLAYYGDWYADFEITVNKDVTMNAYNDEADGYLAGQYDGWEIEGYDPTQWLKVPFTEDVKLKANEPLKIMAFAADLMNKTGLKYTYEEVYNNVKDFNCGAFFTEEFLAENPDLEVTLELRMYNPADETESYKIGETYKFTLEKPELPTATVTEIENEDLTFAMNFKADEATKAQLAYYGDWYADFEITVNKDVTMNAYNDEADGYLAGQYDGWEIEGYDPTQWLKVPFTEDVKLKANEPLKIMAFAADLMNKTGLKYTYEEVYNNVKDFNCGAFFTEEFLAENPDLEVTLELRMYNPADETESYKIGETYKFTLEKPELPTATVTEIENEDLTFAMNFKADEATKAQLAYYGDWYADFEITVNKDVTMNAYNDEADGYLAGQYDGWEIEGYDPTQWLKVPFTEDVKLKANEPLKIMAFAADLMNKTGLKYTYKEVYENVKDFNCGAFFTPEFLVENPDLEVTLELKMYNPADETENYVIGKTYIFKVEKPELPTATVTEIENEDLTFAMNFKADEATAYQLAYYGDWYADFELTVNKDVTLNAYNNEADGYLAGQYDGWEIEGYDPTQWLKVPFTEDVKLKANEPLKIMAFAADLMNKTGLKYTYKEVYENVKDFDCGMFFTEEFKAANPDLTVTLELKMYNPADESENYSISGEYIFTLDGLAIAQNVQTGKYYTDLQVGLSEAAAGQTVKMLQDIDMAMTYVTAGTLDLNGYTLTTDYMSAFGNVVDNGVGEYGLLAVSESKLLLQTNNTEVPVKCADGYRFIEVLSINEAIRYGNEYVFQPKFEARAHEMLLQEAETTGVTIRARVSWTGVNGKRSQDFIYSNDKVVEVIGSYNSTTGKYSRMFTLTLANQDNFAGLKCDAVVSGNRGVEVTKEIKTLH